VGVKSDHLRRGEEISSAENGPIPVMAINSSRAWVTRGVTQRGGARVPPRERLGDTSKGAGVWYSLSPLIVDSWQLGWVREGADHVDRQRRWSHRVRRDASLDLRLPGTFGLLSDHDPWAARRATRKHSGAEGRDTSTGVERLLGHASVSGKAATVDIEREDPLDLARLRRDLPLGQACRPRNRAVTAPFPVDAH